MMPMKNLNHTARITINSIAYHYHFRLWWNLTMTFLHAISISCEQPVSVKWDCIVPTLEWSTFRRVVDWLKHTLLYQHYSKHRSRDIRSSQCLGDKWHQVLFGDFIRGFYAASIFLAFECPIFIEETLRINGSRTVSLGHSTSRREFPFRRVVFVRNSGALTYKTLDMKG